MRNHRIRRHSGRHTPLALALGALGVAALSAPGAAQQQVRKDPPRKVVISPNAIQDPAKPMVVRVQGSPGQTMHLYVLQSCDNDPATPEFQGQVGGAKNRGPCQSPLWKRSVTLDQHGRYTDKLDLRKLTNVPPNKPLWLRVSASRSGRRAKRDVMFAIARDPCRVLGTVLGAFGKGKCVAGVSSAMAPTRGSPDELPKAALAVRLLDMDAFVAGNTRAFSSVPHTRGATGVNWWGEGALAVTMRGPDDREQRDFKQATLRAERLAREKGQKIAKPAPWVAAGLYKVDKATGARELLYQSPEGTMASAPLVVNETCVVFIEDTLAMRSRDRKSALVIWDRGRTPRKMSLARTVHQILGVDRKNQAVLAYSLWQRAPTLVRVSMRDGAVIDLGSDARLVHAAFRSPRDPLTALAQQSVSSVKRGWELIFVDDAGVMKHEVAVGPGSDLLPSWRADGKELLFLGQVAR